MQAINWTLRILGLIFLILFQVLVLSKLNVSIYVHPYVYPMFLILLPFDTPRWLNLIVAFLVGLTIDMFTNTYGMHAAASVFIAFARPRMIKVFTPITGYEGVNAPSISELGIIWYTFFTATMILLHHTVYFMISIFWTQNFSFVLLEILMSTLFSTLLIVILAFLFANRKRRL